MAAFKPTGPCFNNHLCIPDIIRVDIQRKPVELSLGIATVGAQTGLSITSTGCHVRREARQVVFAVAALSRTVQKPLYLYYIVKNGRRELPSLLGHSFI